MSYYNISIYFILSAVSRFDGYLFKGIQLSRFQDKSLFFTHIAHTFNKIHVYLQKYENVRFHVIAGRT